MTGMPQASGAAHIMDVVSSWVIAVIAVLFLVWLLAILVNTLRNDIGRAVVIGLAVSALMAWGLVSVVWLIGRKFI